jgi:putative transposase
VNRLCQAAGVSRAGYYRFLLRAEAQPTDMELRSQIQGIALQWPAYGYRRVQKELQRQGWPVNHKRVLGLMRADNLLCLRRRKFILTTDSKHGLPIYPNLAKEMVLTDINQLWVADITYIRLAMEFVYLAVLLDAFSRRCVGWALQRSLEAALVLEALRMALRRRRPHPGVGAPLRSRGAICVCRLYDTTGTIWHPHQHEPARQCLRQCFGGDVHQDSQIRGSLPD